MTVHAIVVCHMNLTWYRVYISRSHFIFFL
jgi:hypothetical protein